MSHLNDLLVGAPPLSPQQSVNDAAEILSSQGCQRLRA